MDIDEIARVLRGRYGRRTVAGLSNAEVAEVQRDQGVAKLPAEWRKFLSVMGRRAGGLLVGTSVFHPEILGGKRDAFDDYPPLRDLATPPGDYVVLGTHQGYQFYVMHCAAPQVFLYTENDTKLVEGWPSLTAMLEDELSTLFRVEAFTGEKVQPRMPERRRTESAFVRWWRKGWL